MNAFHLKIKNKAVEMAGDQKREYLNDKYLSDKGNKGSVLSSFDKL